VIADLVTLQVKRNLDPGHESEGDESFCSPSIPVMFAVTDLMAPGSSIEHGGMGPLLNTLSILSQ